MMRRQLRLNALSCLAIARRATADHKAKKKPRTPCRGFLLLIMGRGYYIRSMEVTQYFAGRRKDRPYLQDKWLQKALDEPEYVEVQPDGRKRHYIYISEYDKYLRVVFEGEMVHNAFLDRRFKGKRH
jgi:hypothetical protein